MTNELDIQSIFDALPGNYLILLPDSPRFTIVAVSDSYAAATHTDKSIIGRGLFEVFPDNPEEPDADGVRNLHMSLDSVISTKTSHKMHIQKYDVRDKGGQFTEKYWSPLNTPVLDNKGGITFIIHRVADVTEAVKMEEREKRSREIAEEQRKLFTQLIMQAPVAVAVLSGPSFIIQTVNKKMCEHWNRSPEQLLNKPLYDAIPESANQGFEQMLRNIFISGETFISKDGRVDLMKNGKVETAYVDFTCSPLYGLNDTVISIMVVANDVTDIVKARRIIAGQAGEDPS